MDPFQKISPIVASIIMKLEGVHRTPYICPAGLETIGVGHVIRSGNDYNLDTIGYKKGDSLTQRQVAELLLLDLSDIVEELSLEIEVGESFSGLRVTQAMMDAIVMFCFNLGVTKFLKSSIYSYICAGHKEDAADFMLRYKYASGKVLPGLLKRRHIERAIFLYPDNDLHSRDIDKKYVDEVTSLVLEYYHGVLKD